MIDITSETVLSIAQAAKAVPSRSPGKRVHTATIWRWISYGCKGILLESCRIGGSTYTSREALQRFADALTRANPKSVRLPNQAASRSKQIEAAERACEAAGI